jgi:nucleolar MIF4G domain-containing protein 1
MRFMVETLTNLKNNKTKRTAGQQHQGGEAVERMKKFLSGIARKRHGTVFFSDTICKCWLTGYCMCVVLAHEPLRVSLEDLHTAESKGKWWLVGAAWGGDPLVDRQSTTKADQNVDANDMSDNALLQLARKQGMNTDIRRSIFVVLMSSDVSLILVCHSFC